MRPRRGLVCLGLLLVLGIAAASEGAGEVAGDTDQLIRVLRGASLPVELAALKMAQGCGPAGCIAALGGVVVDTEAGALRRAGGSTLEWIVAGRIPVADLPEVNWAPLRGFRVRRAGRSWGVCIEFGHTGLGNSGRAQRWRTLVLVPASGRSAHRFTGYRASCEALVRGAHSGEVALPIVELAQPGTATLEIVWHRCDAQRCVREPDPRSVEGSPASEDGRLTIQ